MIFKRNGSTRCAIENTYEKGGIPFKKLISCHLYPIRIDRYFEYIAVNYHYWHIWQVACKIGQLLKRYPSINF
ncbi:MAG: DUF3109 family protein [Flavobacteriales bacterium AspAUS03]